MLNFNKKIGQNLSLTGVLGSNIRRQNVDAVLASTIGGLVVPELYSLSNSVYELPFPVETKYSWGVNGIYAQGSLGYKDTYFMEASLRRDASSTLPKNNNDYYYPALSGSIILSNLIKSDAVNFAKIRTNYAEVGNDAPPLSLVNTFQRDLNFHGNPIYSLPNTIKNPNVKLKDFQWNVTVNWSRNRNKVISLPAGLENLQLGSFQGGITINAAPGEPYGAIKGTDFIYLNGQPVINQSTGRYLETGTSDNIIGNINPDWIGGIRNNITYKNLALSFLIDMQKGGDIFSLDMYYGLATGLYPETADNGVRDTGIILPGVAPDGTPNNVYTTAPQYYGNNYGYRRTPDKAFVYDASYVKLREVSISYNFSKALLKKVYINNAKLSLVGTNLWIIHKNLPYADPESGLTSGNLSRGYSVGSLPTTRNIGVNLTLKF